MIVMGFAEIIDRQKGLASRPFEGHVELSAIIQGHTIVSIF